MKKTYKKLVLSIALLIASLLFSTCLFAKDIVIYGDSQFNEDAQEKVVQAILFFKPAYVFRVGDIVNDGYDARQWETFNRIAKPLLETSEYFPALGNHENNSPLYFSNFGFSPDKRWYSVDREGIHFIILDSNSSFKNDSPQYLWLLDDLDKVDKNIKFKILLFHHPLYSVGSHKEDEKGLRPGLLPLIDKYGICAVFSGHEHAYEHFEAGKTQFIITGGGGSYLVNQTRTSPYLKKFQKVYHFCLISPKGNYLKVRVIDVDGNIIDDFKISPQQGSG